VTKTHSTIRRRFGLLLSRSFVLVVLKVQEKVQQSGIRETAGQTWRDVVERGRNVAHIGRARVNESIEAAKRKYNQSIEDGAER